MHEMSLAVDIVDLAVRTAEREEAQRVSRVGIEVGNLAGVLIDSLEFCLGAAAQDTLAEGAVFQVTPQQASGTCKDCGIGFDVVSFYQHCPDCDGISVEITGGRQLKVAAITIEEEEPHV